MSGSVVTPRGTSRIGDDPSRAWYEHILWNFDHRRKDPPGHASDA